MLNGGKVAVKKILAKNLELNEEDLLKDILKDTKSQKSVLSRTKRFFTFIQKSHTSSKLERSKEEHQKNMHMLFEREIRIMAQMRHPSKT